MKFFKPLRNIKLCLIKIFFWQPLKAKSFRRWVFDSSPKNTLMISNAKNENFIISSQDKTIARELYITKEYDLSKLETALKILKFDKLDSLLIDVGANIGTICIPAIKRNYFSKAIAIEPDPINFNLLKANIYLNDLGDEIDTYNCALGEKAEEDLILELSESNFGDHRIRRGSPEEEIDQFNKRNIQVKSKSIDSMFQYDSNQQVLLWMDTQGYEGYILAGASNLLSNRIPIVVEFWPYGMMRANSYLKLKAALISAGYQTFYKLDGDIVQEKLSEAALDALWSKIGETGKFTDLLII